MRSLLLLLSAGALASAAHAQVETTTSADTQRRSRNLTNAVSSGITYQPPPSPAETEEKLRAEKEAEERARKNGIIRLPTYVVNGQRPPVFVERDFNKNKALAALALSRSPGLNIGGPLAGANAPIALQAYQEELRLQQMSALQATAESYRAAGDNAKADELDAITREAYRRTGTDDKFSPIRNSDRLNIDAPGGRTR